jgi:GNAT superfamily N-acetyltransferase
MIYVIEKRTPTVEEFNELRRAAEWPVLSDALTREGLSRSLFAVCVLVDSQVIATGRVIGDNAIYFHVSDVLVHPAYQRQGYGRIVMQKLMLYIDEHSGPGTNIGLMASKGREKFYEDFGFIRRPSEKFGAGMILIRK